MYRSSTATAELIALRDPSSIGFAADAPSKAGRATGHGGGVHGIAPRDGLNAKIVRSIIEARAVRQECFGGDLFADPAWDMLLELYALTCEGRRVSVSKLSLAAGVPATTALRWIDKLEAGCLIVRVDDPFDARRAWIMLSRAGKSAMQAFVERVAGRGAGL